MPIDDAQLAEWARLCGEATAGPWEVYETECPPTALGIEQGFTSPAEVERRIGTAYDHPQLSGPAPVVTTGCGPFHSPTTRIRISPADAAFIKAARTALPTLLDEVRRLREENRRWNDQWDALALAMGRDDDTAQAKAYSARALVAELVGALSEAQSCVRPKYRNPTRERALNRARAWLGGDGTEGRG